MKHARAIVSPALVPLLVLALAASIVHARLPPSSSNDHGVASADASGAARPSTLLADSVRFTIVGRIDGSGFHGVEVSGDRAFLTHDRAALIAYDLRDPSKPRELGRADSRGAGRQIELDGDMALVADDKGEILLIDVSSRAAPRLVGTMDFDHPERAMATRDGIGYVADGKDLVLLDLAAPASPSELGRLELDYFGPAGIALSDRFAFIPLTWDRLQIVDIGDPKDPTLRGSLADVDGGAGMGASVGFDGTHAYLGERVHGYFFIPTPVPPTPGPSPTGPTRTPLPAATPPPDGGRLSVVDVSDPDAPLEIGRSDAFYGNPVRHVNVAGDLAWLVTGRGNVMVLDISDPTHPSTVRIEYDPPLASPYSFRTHDVTSDGRYTYLVTDREVLILRRWYERGAHVIRLPWAGGGP